MDCNSCVLHGDIVYSGSREHLSVFENSYVVVENGMVSGIFPVLPEEYRNLELKDFGRGLIIPAFSDLHVHAPQYAQRGTGMDMLLPDWLNSYTFPEESRFSDTAYAEKVYSLFVDDMIRNGTFRASVFATVHGDSSRILAEIMEKRGMHGFVGAVNMDMQSPPSLLESTAESLSKTESFIAGFQKNAKVRPVITPRFAPTCSDELLCGLGKLAAKYSCGMQTHMVESLWEAETSVKLHPGNSCDTEIYERAGLLDEAPPIFAHFIFPSDRDMELAEKYGAVTVHCPDATNNIIAGIMPVSSVSAHGIATASGTDVGAGSRLGVYHQVARTVQLSKLKEFYEPGVSRTVSFPEAFHMATRGGEKVFGRCGSFEIGSPFDALVLTGLEDADIRLSPADRLEKFCYTGDDRNIAARFIEGKEIFI